MEWSTWRGRTVTARRRRAAVVAVVATSLAAPAAAGATAPAAAIVRVSVDHRGGDADANAWSDAPRISASGRHVAFTSFASDLVPGDRQGHADVFVRDLVAGTTTRASVDRAGGNADGDSWDPSISADGRYVAFASAASDLAAVDRNGASDVFVRDLATGTTTRVSVDAAGGDAGGASDAPWISGDGRSVAFASLAPDLAPDGNAEQDVFLRDLTTDTTTRVSVDITGGDAGSVSSDPVVSHTGRHVAFTSFAADLVAGDGNGAYDVFVRDVVTGTTTRVSVDGAGGDANGDTFGPSISATGRHVAFFSFASDVVAGDGNGVADAFVRDTATGATTRVSVDAQGGDANGRTYQPSISTSGRHVAFFSAATDLAGTDGNRSDDVFVRDLAAGTTTRVSVDADGGDPDGPSLAPTISADGGFVAFPSLASDLVPGDGNGMFDVFVRDLR